MKKCTQCGKIKNESDFSKHQKNKDGLRCNCKMCDQQYYRDNKKNIIENKKQYNQDHKEERKNYESHYRRCRKTERNKQNKERRQYDPLFKLKGNIRSRIQQSIKNGGYSKDSKTYEYLKCSFEEFLEYLGPQSEPNMSLDHICPCAQHQNEEELIKLQHYTNFRWMTLSKNSSKNDRKTPEAEEMCRKLLGREWISKTHRKT